MTNTRYSAPICRVLAIFDGETEELAEVIELLNFDLNSFTTQFDVPVETDPQMLDRYAVGPIDVEFMRAHVPVGIAFEFSRYAYFIDAAKRE
jgi:hypothetical protein